MTFPPRPLEAAEAHEPELLPAPDLVAHRVRAEARVSGETVAGEDDLLELLAASDGPEPWDAELCDALAEILAWLLEDLPALEAPQ